MKFKDFLINEDKAYLGLKVGDILNAIQDLLDSADGMGLKHLATNSERIVNQIRRILHTSWPREDEKYLKILQKIGVAIMKAIEEKDDLKDVLTSASEELSGLLERMNVPINNLGTAPGEDSRSTKDS